MYLGIRDVKPQGRETIPDQGSRSPIIPRICWSSYSSAKIRGRFLHVNTQVAACFKISTRLHSSKLKFCRRFHFFSVSCDFAKFGELNIRVLIDFWKCWPVFAKIGYFSPIFSQKFAGSAVDSKNNCRRSVNFPK